jgi:hypothetical protein
LCCGVGSHLNGRKRVANFVSAQPIEGEKELVTHSSTADSE